ncbi:MAG: hypothetical protein KC502_16745 [Myxococcales bacterium]|nr:hypothetical protein [Myxococcales bacterium]
MSKLALRLSLAALLMAPVLNSSAAEATPKARTVASPTSPRFVVKLPTKAIRGRIAKPQVMLFLGRRAPVFRPWIANGTPIYDRRGKAQPLIRR